MLMAGIAIPILAGLPLLAQDRTTSREGIPDFSREKEAAIGSQLAAEVRKRSTPLEISAVQAYIERLGQRLSENMPETNIRFSFNVIAEDSCPTTHEPAALPGGHVFVPAALFLASENEYEFARMVAHAMAHIAERHGVRQAAGVRTVNSTSIPLIFLGGWTGSCNEATLVPRSFVNTWKTYEKEADARAAQIMSRAAAAPDGAAEEFAAVREQVRGFVLPRRSAPPSLVRKTPE